MPESLVERKFQRECKREISREREREREVVFDFSHTIYGVIEMPEFMEGILKVRSS